MVRLFHENVTMLFSFLLFILGSPCFDGMIYSLPISVPSCRSLEFKFRWWWIWNLVKWIFLHVDIQSLGMAWILIFCWCFVYLVILLTSSLDLSCRRFVRKCRDLPTSAAWGVVVGVCVRKAERVRASSADSRPCNTRYFVRFDNKVFLRVFV
jgi:hypothetical protein